MRKQTVNDIKALALNQINAAQSGHPGICLGFSEVLYVLYNKIANVHPSNSKFLDRDRVVLSAGHGSAMLYSTLHISGFDYSIDDLKSFRKIGSKTPGHPEQKYSGVDATTGPLGQGVGNAVGMAIASKRLNQRYNNISNELFDNYVYTIVGDGCLNEGVSFESFSVASKLKLDNFIVLHDANKVTLDGELSNSTNIDEISYFKALGFDTFECFDTSNLSDVENIILEAKKSNNPAYIKFHTVIGNGSKSQGTNFVHGSPLNQDDYNQTIKDLNGGDFHCSKDSYDDFIELNKNSLKHIQNVNSIIENIENEAVKNELIDLYNDDIEYNFDYLHANEDKPTRDAFVQSLSSIANNNDLFIVASADIASSTKVYVDNEKSITSNNYDLVNLNLGVREFAMGCISNGLHSYNIKTFTSTFLSFFDYMKSSIRISALSNINNVFVFSHDSIYIGEDGPTHQPVEQISNLRSIPNLTVIKPVDYNQTQHAIKFAINYKDGPVCIVSTRQNVSTLSLNKEISLGAHFIIRNDKYDIQLLASGSEVQNAIEISRILLKKNIVANVVNISSFELLAEDKKLNDELIHSKENNYSIELSNDYIWLKYSKYHFGYNEYGMSASENEIKEKIDLNNKVINYILSDLIW